MPSAEVTVISTFSLQSCCLTGVVGVDFEAGVFGLAAGVLGLGLGVFRFDLDEEDLAGVLGRDPPP